MREWMMSFADVIMRVPPLFVIDELLRICPGFSGQTSSEMEKMGNNNFTMMNVSDSFIGVIASASSEPFLQHLSLNAYQIYFMTAFKVIACCLGKNLSPVYTFLEREFNREGQRPFQLIAISNLTRHT